MNNQQFLALVADDEPIVCKSVSRCLRDEGFYCDTAADGKEAIQLIERSDYDVVITDLKMPKMNGQGLILELIRRGGRPVIVVLTAVDHPKIAQELILMGVDDVMFKPVNHVAFAAKVKALAMRRRQSTALEQLWQTADTP